mmetsp:Transcript_15915/g.62186  ORF Transcript_15915/g.62186 Transcript_15915/m.62186 type:complete len:405 (-) Transcript_15915:16-1230(-)
MYSLPERRKRGVREVWQGLAGALAATVLASLLFLTLLPSPCDNELDMAGSSLRSLASREVGMAWRGSQPPLATIVVPAFREADNIQPLVEQVFGELERAGLGGRVQMVVVDDNSNDGSEELVRELHGQGYAVGIVTRLRERGLSSAVLAGFLWAEGEVLLCMDADLQHPASAVPEMIAALSEPMSSCSFALGTRAVPTGVADPETGEVHSWPLHRRVISAGAALLAWPLARPAVSDPMTGFFAITREEFDRIYARGDVNAVGFKIALELLVRGQLPPPDGWRVGERARGEGEEQHHCEVAFEFGVRMAGESKLSGKVIVYYVAQLASLYVARFPLGVAVAVIFCLAVYWATAAALSVHVLRQWLGRIVGFAPRRAQQLGWPFTRRRGPLSPTWRNGGSPEELIL